MSYENEEIRQTLHELKVIQKRRSAFIYIFSLFVILPTCLVLLITNGASLLVGGALMKGMFDASQSEEMRTFDTR